MTCIVTQAGFGPDIWGDRILPFEALWTGQDLPVEGPLAVRLPVDRDATELAPWFDRIALVAIPFAASADGRGFSLARQLRRSGYGGRIRAEGHVLPDQFRAALRTGIDEVAIPDTQAARTTEDQWLAVDLSEGYHARLFAAE